MSESSMEFLERMRFLLERNLPLCVEEFDRLIALAEERVMVEEHLISVIPLYAARDAQEELAKAVARKFRGDPNNNWLMKPSLDWLENAEHGENQARCRMIAGMLRDLWCGDDTLGAMPVAIDAAIPGATIRKWLE